MWLKHLTNCPKWRLHKKKGLVAYAWCDMHLVIFWPRVTKQISHRLIQIETIVYFSEMEGRIQKAYDLRLWKRRFSQHVSNAQPFV